MAYIAIVKRQRKAVLLIHDEVRDQEGWRVIVKVWQVPVSANSPDGVDYSLALISPAGERAGGDNNHWPKGPHRHVWGKEAQYTYRGVEPLLADFQVDVAQVRRLSS